MDGKNSSGRRISLLNDSAEPQLPIRLPSIAPSLRSRTSSYTSSPIGSPATPYLVRSDSTDSAATMQTPSPITPEFGFEGLPPQHLNSPVFNQHSFFPAQKELVPAYPPLPSDGSLFLPPAAGAPQPGYFRPQQSTDGHNVVNGAASANPRSKKNSYPCPVAKRPSPAKDNMEQHRRTHQSGRNAKGTDNSLKKAKAQANDRSPLLPI
ncbi:hypothetical protein N0V90_006669 [Kalmusia sp. IMI 367209]|nr:hypothetical protein N0V90_006669 [Kalmusia sp. IMI 367209]